MCRLARAFAQPTRCYRAVVSPPERVSAIWWKIRNGTFFDVFRIGPCVRHGDAVAYDCTRRVALYCGLFRPRALRRSLPASLGDRYPHSPIDDLLVFHVSAANDCSRVSLNAVRQSRYAAMSFPFSGPIRRHPERGLGVIGLKETSSARPHRLWWFDRLQAGRHKVLEYARWSCAQAR